MLFSCGGGAGRWRPPLAQGGPGAAPVVFSCRSRRVPAALTLTRDRTRISPGPKRSPPTGGRAQDRDPSRSASVRSQSARIAGLTIVDPRARPPIGGCPARFASTGAARAPFSPARSRSPPPRGRAPAGSGHDTSHLRPRPARGGRAGRPPEPAPGPAGAGPGARRARGHRSGRGVAAGAGAPGGGRLRPPVLTLGRRSPGGGPARLGRAARAQRPPRDGLLRRADRGAWSRGRRPTATPAPPTSRSPRPVAVGTRVAGGAPVGTLELAGSHCFPRACLHWGGGAARSTWTPSAWSGPGRCGCCRCGGPSPWTPCRPRSTRSPSRGGPRRCFRTRRGGRPSGSPRAVRRGGVPAGRRAGAGRW